MRTARNNKFNRPSRLPLAIGVLALTLHAPQAVHAGPSSGASMLTTASNASLPAAQTNLGLPLIVKAVGDGITDDWAKIQAAIDSATAPATIAIPSKPNGIRISQALRMRDNVTLWSLNWNQPWKCTGDAAGALAQWPFYGCVLFGSGTATNLALLTPIPVNDPEIGDVTMTLTSGNYTTLDPAVGDLIVIGSAATFTIGSGPGSYPVPQVSQLVRVTAVNAGSHTVTISAPIEVATTGTRIYKLTNTGLNAVNATGTDTGIPMWATYKASVIGGAWTTSVPDAPFAAGGGALEPVVKIASFTGGYGVGYLNLWAGGRGEVENQYIKNKPLELSWSSHGNSFRIGRIEMTGNASPDWILGGGEGARGNKVEVGFVNVGVSTPDKLVNLNRASNSSYKIGTAVGSSLTSYAVYIKAGDYVGTPPNTADNVVQIDSNNIAAATGYVSIEGLYKASTATVGGTLTGYTNGDVVTQGTTGGACSVAPSWTLTVSGGNVTAATVNNPGRCNTRPSNPVSVTGGSGSGLTLTVTYTGSEAVNNTVLWGAHHGTVSGNAFRLLGVGVGNWIEGWGDNGTITQDSPSSTQSGFRNLRDANGHYLNSQTSLVSGLGIGTTAPGAPLAFAGTTGADKVHWGSPTAGIGLASGGAAVIWGPSADSNGALIFKRDSRTNPTDLAITPGGLIGIGGVTSSQPALKNTAGTLKIRKADDSAYAPVQGKLTTDTNYAAGATTATGYLTLYDATGTAYKVNACLASAC